MSLDDKIAIPNKLLQNDGTITDIAGNPVVNATEVYNLKPAIPNKFLNPDGSYSKLEDIISGGGSVDLFIVVEQLPASGETNKIYLVPDGDGGFIEYHWTGTAWDPIGTITVDLSNYYTKTETDTNFLNKTNSTEYTPSQNYHPSTKKYVDDNIANVYTYIQSLNGNEVAY